MIQKILIGLGLLLMILVILLTEHVLRRGATDDDEELFGELVRSQMTTQILDEAQSTFGPWVSIHGTLPSSLDDLFEDEGQGFYGLADPLDPDPNGELKYKRISDEYGILYSVGYDGIDDRGKVIYRHSSAPIVIENFSILTAPESRRATVESLPEFAQIRGDMVFFLAVVDCASGEQKCLSATYLSPPDQPQQ